MMHDRRALRSARLPALLVVVLLVALPLSGCGSSVSAVPEATVPPFPGNGTPPLLVDAAWLRTAMTASGDGLLVVDLSALSVYRRGHVPGAVHAWWQDTMEVGSLVYGTVLSAGDDGRAQIEFLAALGVGDDTTVVAYDGDSNRYAALLVWLLRALGHDQAMVLDGGLAAWKGAGGDVSRGEFKSRSATPGGLAPRAGVVVGAEELRDRIGDPNLVVLDARTDAEAADDLNGTLRMGRIPGAVSVPWTATLRDAAGRLKSPEELAALFRDAGVTPDREVVVYTRFGVEAAQTWLVLTLLGYPRVLIYDWGWAGWGSRSDLPIET